jgi:hypothetical protein
LASHSKPAPHPLGTGNETDSSEDGEGSSKFGSFSSTDNSMKQAKRVTSQQQLLSKFLVAADGEEIRCVLWGSWWLQTERRSGVCLGGGWGAYVRDSDQQRKHPALLSVAG